ncbi:hypothetical protein BC830DRAFT_19898 [Chytriomyces sp. MP71]|nr:hypothetical protein BC830DRAFT_19898 [Chytriomyces sp. MP71]
MCEMDLIRCNDMDTVLHRLKENARRVWEVCAKKSNSKPLIAKSSVLSKPGTRAIAVPEINIDQPRLPETFDLSMMIPDGRDHLSDFQVLDGKKHMYGLILKNNEDLRIAEQDLPASERSTNLMIDPTVATIFAEHEVNSYLLLRFCKIRELRNTLRLQLNYFRSIEKRINLDVRQSKLRHKLSPLEASSFKPSYQNISSTFKNNNASFDTEDYGSNKQESPDSKAPNVIFSNPRLAENMATEDFRYSRNGRIDIQDHKGVSIIYDVVLSDLQILENELTKLATIYINNGLYGRVQGNSSFYNDLLLKKERRADVKDATFINPIVDRAQLLLELYDAEVRYQNAKIEVVGCYMELFEHCKSSSDLKKLPIKLLVLSNFHVGSILHTILQHRDWIERHLSKASPGPEEQDSTNGAGSMLRSGLPWKSASDDEEFVTMHHCAMSLKITEVVPAMALISKVQKQAKTLCQEFYSLLQVILAKNGVVATPSRSAAECVVWKGLNRVWKDLANHDFMLPLKGRRLIGGLENDNWLENPLLPEMILAEKYNPFDLQAEGGEKYIPNMIAPYTIFTDPHFQPHARDILCRVLKVIVMRNRLYFAWIETGASFGIDG